ncbi:class I tRNA ligase family protein [Vibrio artabrorum]|nr:class I tRNA ligase family protein [Vibrio artabrorum]
MKITKKIPDSFKTKTNKINTRDLVIPPSEKTNIHNHHDREYWSVKSGEGVLYSNNKKVKLTSGDYIEFSPFEAHTVENLGNEDFCFTSYWYVDWESLLAVFDQEQQFDSKLMIETAFPTPNGPLHLGHLSGAYLISDIQKRCCELIGIEYFSYCGTYGHTNHIDKTAICQKVSYDNLVSRSEEAIFTALERFQVNYNSFLPHFPSSEEFQYSKNMFLNLLNASPFLIEREVDHPYSEASKEYVCESYVAGGCPQCGEITIGIECENCGLYQDECNLIAPFHSVTKENLVLKPVNRLYIKLEKEISDKLLIQMYCNNNAMSRVCYDNYNKYLDKGNLKYIPVSSLRKKGVPVYGEQVLSVVMERALRSYHGISQYPRANRHLFFCGYDNMCGSGMLLPYILKILGIPNSQLPVGVINNFCLLENKKFSTGENHAIWANEFLSSHPSDLVRLYLSYIQSPTINSNFCLKELYNLSNQFVTLLITIFEEWNRLNTYYTGIVEAGPWLKQDIIFYKELNSSMSFCIDNLLSYASKATVNRVIYLLKSIKDYIFESDSYRYNQNYLRTRLALISYAYQCLAFCLYPLTPIISTCILDCLNTDIANYQSQKNEIPVIEGLDFSKLIEELSKIKEDVL